MQRRLRNTLAIAVAGAAVIVGAGTAAASPADDVTGSAPQLGSATDQLGSAAKVDKGDKGKGDKGKSATDGLNTDELGSAADLGSATDSLPTKDLGGSAPALGGLGK